MERELAYLKELVGIGFITNEDKKDRDRRIRLVCDSIEAKLGLGAQAEQQEEGRHHLSPPLSIGLRLQAAIAEGERHQIVHYNRKEGASRAIAEIARGREDIVVISRHVMKEQYQGCAFASSTGNSFRGIRRSTVILDAVPRIERDHIVRTLLANETNRVIEVKGIAWDERFGYYRINGEPMDEKAPGKVVQSDIDELYRQR